MMEDLYLFLEGVNFKWELIHSALGYLSPLEFEQKFYQNLLSGGCLMTSLPFLPADRQAGVLAEPKTNRESIPNHFPQSIFLLKAKLI